MSIICTITGHLIHITFWKISDFMALHWKIKQVGQCISQLGGLTYDQVVSIFEYRSNNDWETILNCSAFNDDTDLPITIEPALPGNDSGTLEIFCQEFFWNQQQNADQTIEYTYCSIRRIEKQRGCLDANSF